MTASWKAQGYFTGPSSVMMRKVGVVGRDWVGDVDTNALQKSGNSTNSGHSGMSDPRSSEGNVTGKVRFNFESDSKESIGSENASKKRKLDSSKEGSSAQAAQESAQDLMDDLEDDDEADNVPSSSVSVSAQSVSAVSSSNSVGEIVNKIETEGKVEEEVRGQWISSDEIDFDAYSEEKGEEVDEAEVDDDEDDV